MTANKYTTALLQFVLVLITAVQAALTGGLDTVEMWQLVALGVAAVGTYFLPLVQGPWAGALKVGVAVVGAAIAAVIPLVNGVWTGETFIIVLLAALNALAAQIGVSVRIDDVKAQLANPAVSDAVVYAADRPAAKVVQLVPRSDSGRRAA